MRFIILRLLPSHFGRWVWSWCHDAWKKGLEFSCWIVLFCPRKDSENSMSSPPLLVFVVNRCSEGIKTLRNTERNRIDGASMLRTKLAQRWWMGWHHCGTQFSGQIIATRWPKICALFLHTLGCEKGVISLDIARYSAGSKLVFVQYRKEWSIRQKTVNQHRWHQLVFQENASTPPWNYITPEPRRKPAVFST